MDRRSFIGNAAALGMAGLAARPERLLAQGIAPAPFGTEPILPLAASPDRIFRTTVCLRPFRAVGPRLEVERIAGKRIVHHYGHGGSGWSLSWGSALDMLALALQDSPKEIAVVGAGAIGLTSAITLQRAGAKVTIYSAARFPDVRSARATGTWSPDSRVAMADKVAPDFADRWERMARASFARHQSYLGLPGDPVDWTDRYNLFDTEPPAAGNRPHVETGLHFAEYQERLRDLVPRTHPLAPGTHPFRVPFARKTTSLMFNVADFAHTLETDFQLAGGRFVPMELHEPSDFAKIREKVIVNCTGYGARALMRDESIVPVRGQIAWLIPQAGLRYGLFYRDISVLARKDGIVVQAVGADDSFGYNDANESPDRAAADASVATIASLFEPPAKA
ncbi:FAD-dependent oxidoreductase [Sphingomonas sp. AP4-R1]|uniref:FAD-dependent oxidoreductase n=1 Tax=Sphingomonas sp. AP4-R1 TaxID=2735134 RepID=UPI0014933D68|nr:FAD-dependent oxidoreductase [Sphingomonas sp. AP4-R1]QJU57015.1 FAD-dependent oxidoreductase [Sphingomonas sp. AP4-R1]